MTAVVKKSKIHDRNPAEDTVLSHVQLDLGREEATLDSSEPSESEK